MTTAARKLLDEALALPDDEREFVLRELHASFRPTADWEAAWEAECDRRIADFDAGRSGARTLDEVKQDIQRVLATARKR